MLQRSFEQSASCRSPLTRSQVGSPIPDFCLTSGICYHAGLNSRESFCILASRQARETVFSFGRIRSWGRTLDNPCCLRCNREIEVGQKSVAVYLFAQTVGVRPRQKSSSQRICFCPQCSVSRAMGPPPEGALNIAAWQMIRDLVSADPALNEAAWETLRGVAGLLPATGTDGGPRRTSGGYFEF